MSHGTDTSGDSVYLDPLHVLPPQPARFDAGLKSWVLSTYRDVATVLQADADHRRGDREWHHRYRAAAVTAFSGPQLAFWREAIRKEAQTLCTRLVQQPSFDLVHEFARPIAAATARIVTNLADPAAYEHAQAIFAAAAEPFDEAARETGHRATTLLAEMFEGEWATLNVQAFVALSESLAVFLANSSFALLSHNQAFDTRPAAMEELLRYAAPSKAQFRCRPEGRLVLMLATANRDPSVFQNPDRLDLTRMPNKHLAFGTGSHSCLGAMLVRTASSEVLRVLFDTFPSMSILTVQPAYGLALRAIKSLRASPSTPPRPCPR